jgi:hypothetical protein
MNHIRSNLPRDFAELQILCPIFRYKVSTLQLSFLFETGGEFVKCWSSQKRTKRKHNNHVDLADELL